MKITHNKVGQNLNTNDSGKAERSDKAGAAGVKAGGASKGAEALGEMSSGATRVDLSPRAQEMKKAKEIAMAAPDVNEEKVSRLQKLIDDGKYNVSAKDIADKMVDEELAWS